MSNYVLIYTTTSNWQEARKLARHLVAERFVACANIIPEITSLYWWKNKLQEEKEALLLLKTESRLAPQAVAEIKKLHSYQVPAITVFNIDQGHDDFLRWISEELKEKKTPS